jgi:hypothetical protein
MNFLVSLIFTTFIFTVLFGCINLILIKRRLVSYNLVGVTLIGALLNSAGGILHEFGHVLVAKLYGLNVTLSGNLKGLFITTDPPPHALPPIEQAIIALAGPIVSLVVVLVLWYALQHSHSTTLVVMLTFLLLVQGSQNLASLLYPFSGDYFNFTQGISRLGIVPIGSIRFILFSSFIVWIIVLIKRCLDSIRYLELNAH